LKVLITGSRGYIGSVLAKTLHEQNIIPFGIDHDGRPNGSAIYGMFSIGCITDDLIIECIMDQGIDTIFHLAAYADVGDSVKHPAMYYENNIGKTSLMLLKLLEKGWRGKIIFSSTAAVYKEQSMPVYEGCEIGSPNPYGKSKYACEQLLHDISAAYDIPVAIFRYFNVAGAWDDVGDHIDASHIISRLCDSTYNKKPFMLYGTDKNTPDGTCIRDYVHVRDVCDAHIHVAKFLDHVIPNVWTFNLGTGAGHSNLEIIKAFERFSGHKPIIINGPGRAGDPDHLVAGTIKFVNQTKYRYNHSSLEQIITTAWNYYCNKMESQNGI